jgi:hypothetical protein
MWRKPRGPVAFLAESPFGRDLARLLLCDVAMKASSFGRPQERGVTSLQLLLSLGSLFVLAVGAGIFLSRGQDRDQLRSAEQAAEQILSAAEQWQEDHPSGCPTIGQLMYDRALERGALTEDPWGSRFRVICRGATIMVRSPGRDGRSGTEDDIRMPRS